MINRLNIKLHSLLDQQLLDLPPRAEVPYLTHIPVLLNAAKWRKLESVVEFGCGDNSTSAFLNPSYFSDLKKLVSYENDAAWADRVRSKLNDDPRLDLRLVEGPVSSVVERVDLEQFDLIFIDDSITGEERSATISAVAAKRPRRAIVVVHDFEYYPYRVAARPFKHRFRFTGQNPNTGLLWNEAELDLSKLRELNQKLRSLGEKESVSAWAAVLSANI